MELKINGQVKELRFGAGFIRKLDEIYETEMDNLKFGTGLIMSNLQLAMMNPSVLSNVIRCAVNGHLIRGVASEIEVDNFIDDYAEEHNGLGRLFEEVQDNVGKSSVVKDTLVAMASAEKQLSQASQD